MMLLQATVRAKEKEAHDAVKELESVKARAEERQRDAEASQKKQEEVGIMHGHVSYYYGVVSDHRWY